MTLDFSTLIPAAQAGDKPAQDALMTAFYGWCVTRARGSARLSTDDAANVALGFWEWAFKDGGLKRYNPKRGNFFSWMGLVITRRARDAAAKRKPAVIYSVQEDAYDYGTGLENHTSKMEAEQDLAAIRAKLGKKQKAVLRLILAGATVEEIAFSQRVSKKSAQNLRSQVRRAIRDTRGD